MSKERWKFLNELKKLSKKQKRDSKKIDDEIEILRKTIGSYAWNYDLSEEQMDIIARQIIPVFGAVRWKQMISEYRTIFDKIR